MCYSGLQRPKVTFVRHGVTEMNEHLSLNPWGSRGFKDAGFWDTQLSTAGKRACCSLNGKLLGQSEIGGSISSAYRELLNSKSISLVSSPLTRTLQTSELVFKNVKVASYSTNPLLRERLYLSSDRGRLKSELIKDFPYSSCGISWDFSLLPDDAKWWYETEANGICPYVEWRPAGEYLCDGELESVFKNRMKDLLQWIRYRVTESSVATTGEVRGEDGEALVLVTHWGVIRALTGRSFENCEAGSFHIDELLDEPFID